MVLVQKWRFFKIFFLDNIGQENVFYDILERRNACLGYKNKKFKMSKNWHFSKGVNPWFWSKDGHFFNFFFLGNKGLEIVFYDIGETKNSFVGFKNNKLKNVEKLTFLQKGLTNGFGPKMAIFATFFFRQYRPGKCLLSYSRTRKRLSRL